MTNEGYQDDASPEITMTRYELRLRLGPVRRRVAAVAPATLQAKLRRIGVYLTKRLQRRCPQIAVSMPTWDVVNDPLAFTGYAMFRITWADISGLIDEDGPRMVVIPDTTVNLSIPRQQPNRAQRRAG